MRNTIGYITLSLFVVLALLAGSCGGGASALHNAMTDSLLYRLLSERYSNLDSLRCVADILLGTEDTETQMAAVNARAYESMMSMDYSQAYDDYRFVSENSNSEIERLVADVGLMTVCYRVSENRLFFDHRANALKRIKRINEEAALLTGNDKARFISARIEFGIVSVCYFSNLGMQEQKTRTLQYLEQNVDGCDDVPLRLYAKMILANNVRNDIDRLRMLCDGVASAHEKGLLWLEANYDLLLSISLRDSTRLSNFKKHLPGYYKALNEGGLSDDTLAVTLAHKAAREFIDYGDPYMRIEALSVAASCYTQHGKYDEALANVENAILLVNDYYRIQYPYNKELHNHSIYNNFSISIDSLARDSIYGIYECLLSVRREAAGVFAGYKDYTWQDNYEAYLQLVNETRQNKSLDSRIDSLKAREAELDVFVVVLVLVVLVVALSIAVVYCRRRRHVSVYSSNLNRLQTVCRRMLSSLSHETGSKEELCKRLSQVLDDNLGDFSGYTRFSVASPLENTDGSLHSFYEFELRYMNGGDSDKLYVGTEQPLVPEKYTVLSMLVQYVAVAVEEGMRLSDLSDERERMEEEQRVYSIYLAGHKRENLLKRVSVSVVSGMRPFMDRMMREMKALPDTASADDAERKLQYVAELADRLDDFNVILERWIKMRQGDLNLQVEKFPIADVFGIVEKSRALLERRGIALEVKECNSVVKADKALTLFMVNTLVDNASKFTPQGGTVTLEATEGEGFVEIAVSDTGVGMSQSDIDRILGEKVYDASLIGRDNELLQTKKKGGGFGLMNCKGIIDKYRKTDSLFAVCSMDIKSSKGKGSRFSFRLPKGVQRVVLLLLVLLPGCSFAAGGDFGPVYDLADSVYECNVRNEHEQALVYAQRALDLLNDYYKDTIGGTDTLTLHSGAPSELKWCREEFFPDSLTDCIYYNILYIRSEVSIASLLLHDWQSYRFNNYIFTTLNRLVHEDNAVARRHETALSRVNYRVAVVTFLSVILLVMVLYAVVSYVRYIFILKGNERMLQNVNNRLLQVVVGDRRRAPEELLQAIVDEIYSCMGENMRMDSVAVMLRREQETMAVRTGEGHLLYGNDNIFMQGVIDNGVPYTSPHGLRRVLPLYVLLSGNRSVIGALEVLTMRPLVDDEILNLELVASYAASVAYHALVRVAGSYMVLDEAEEEAERLKYEENRLHVQNMVLDNCLSALKHETIYYPSRIRDLVKQASGGGDNGVALSSMGELMEYYTSIFGILSNCAKRELDDRCFTVSRVGLQQLFERASSYLARRCRKTGVEVTLEVEPTATVVSVDSDLVEFLFESLIDAALKVGKPGVMRLKATDDGGDTVKVELVDTRREVASDELADMFMPTRRNLSPDGALAGMEYLVAKEIVRLHEDNTGRRGSRMEARSDVAGTVILFTLPK